MASYEKICVKAVTDKDGNVPVPVPYRGASGMLVRNRWFGIQHGKPAPEGEIVERGAGNMAELHKAVRQGFITISALEEPVVEPAATESDTPELIVANEEK